MKLGKSVRFYQSKCDGYEDIFPKVNPKSYELQKL